jgi:peptidoglycan hydrolase-like protein with peptidoglycan-binding domain
MFESYPAYPKFRTLKLTVPHQRGEDCYALQTALIGAGFPLPRFGADGDLGDETAKAIQAAQASYGLVVDGLAGGLTQRALALAIARGATARHRLPDGALRGQLEHESSYRLGIYSEAYPNGSYDAGVAQRNTALTPPRDGFTVPESIEALAARTEQYHAKFAGLASYRRWSLAQGAWNAPAFACYLAREEGATGVTGAETRKPTPEQRATFEAYVASVSAYL